MTQSYEEPVREWRGKEGDHHIAYDVSSPDGFFGAGFDQTHMEIIAMMTDFIVQKISIILKAYIKKLS